MIECFDIRIETEDGTAVLALLSNEIRRKGLELDRLTFNRFKPNQAAIVIDIMVTGESSVIRNFHSLITTWPSVTDAYHTLAPREDAVVLGLGASMKRFDVLSAAK